MTRPDIIRFYPEARTAHLERADQMPEAVTLYLHQRGDFDPVLAESRPDFRKVSVLDLVRQVVSSPPRVLEVPEPMWFRYAPETILLLATLRVLRPKSRSRTRVVTYAIENSPVERLPRPLQKVPRPIWTWLARRVVALRVRDVDRIVFGTEGAREALIGAVAQKQRSRIERCSRTIEALPAACACIGDNTDERRLGQVLFLGALEHRKGIDVLLDAWPSVQSEEPTARLVVGGNGPLSSEVTAATVMNPSVTFETALTRSEVHQRLRQSQVLVLLSQPAGRWREQVGLPIIEGVAHGCRVVATDETGMAAWLRSEGQETLPTPTAPEEAARAILTALRAGVALPYHLADVDGRLSADAWLVAQ